MAGKSMFPLLGHGSLAKVALAPFEDMRLGDIAVFKAGSGFMCHRVVGKKNLDKELFLKTKGDAVSCSDPLVRKDAFVGKVITVRKGRFDIKIDNLTCRVIGLALSCLLPFALRMFFWFKNMTMRYEIRHKA